MTWSVVVHPDAQDELDQIPQNDYLAVVTAMKKLEALGPTLGFPHTSAIQGTTGGLRELRPRRGRCAWRAFYQQVGSRLVILAVGPEATVNPKKFKKTIGNAQRRVEQIER
jgi:hypothetical protein